MRVVTQVIVVGIIGGIAAAGWYYRDRLPILVPAGNQAGQQVGGGQPGGPPGGIAVDVATVRTGPVKTMVEAVGTAQANEAVEITTKVTALVKRLQFTDGQTVARGDLLIELDPGELLAQLEENRAELDISRRLLKRAETLFQTRNVPESRVEELQARVLGAEARVKANEARLADYVIRAPFAGKLGIRDASPGTLVRPGTRITTLDDTGIIKLDFDVQETVLAQVRPGLEVTAISAAYPDRAFFGKVVTIDSRVDPVTRSVRVRATIPNGDNLLKPGMFLNVQLVLGMRPEAILAPEEAVITSLSGHFVFRVSDGKAMRAPVTVGQRLPREVEILAGLNSGDVVIVGGIQKVRDGAPVRVGPPPGNSGGAGSAAPQG